MSVLGIVAEFNPFHNGHLLLLEQAGQAGPFDAIICVMSGSFLQRGEPAICHKWARAEMALQCGADLVIELPFCFAARSAYFFARGALQLLQQTGVVTHLAFGCESPHLHILDNIASLLASEPREYKERLKHYLNQGLSFPLARARSLQEFTAERTYPLDEILAAPNNILALEYLRVIKEGSLPFTPVPIVRRGSSYHDTDMHTLASATAIRSLLLEEHNLDRLKMAMPSPSLAVLQREITGGKAPVRSEGLGPPLLIKLRTMSCKELENIYETCHRYELKLFVDGARMGYGLMAEGCDITMPWLACHCDAFYIGGTKVGALCGEAVVFTHNNAPKHFFSIIKQHGALLAKGRLTGVQFDALFTDGLYFDISSHAITMAMRMKKMFEEKGYKFYLDSPTNQQFVVLDNEEMARLEKHFIFTHWDKFDNDHTICRFVTSWATTDEDLENLRSVVLG